MNDIRQFFKRVFTDKDFPFVFFTSFLSFLFLLLFAAIIMWYFRADLFGYFARGYVAEIERENNKETGTGGQPLFSQDSLVVETVKKTSPSVVSIIISKEVPKYEPYMDSRGGEDPFGDLFPGFNFSFPQYRYRENGTEKKEIGGGSGFFVSHDGLILTNKHVVDQKDAEYTVFTNDGKKHTAEVVDRDPVLDIALIKISSTDYPPLPFGDSDALEVGQSVIAIGNALGEYRNTVSVGVISGLARSITAGDRSGNSEILDHVIQTDAAINPGNSGGPLLDLEGRVVGVNVAVAEGSQSIGFALPMNSVRDAIESVKSTGKIVRPYVGIRYVPVTAELKEKNNLSVDYGILVKRGAGESDLAVIPGSPADKAGIVENDLILEVDGIKLDGETNFSSIIRGKKVGQKINLKILHRGAEKNISVTLAAAED